MNRFVWRSRLSLATWALAAGLLSACGGGGDDTPSPTPPPTVAPPVASYVVGGVVTGLSGTVVLREAGGQQVAVSGNGSFALSTQLPAGTPYTISVAQQPVGQVCSVSNGSGVANASVASIAVACQAQTFPIGVQVLALTQPIVLQSNLGDSLTVTVAGTYTLPTPVAYGQPYSVTAQSPASQSCTLTGAQGIAAAPGVNLSVTCQAVVAPPPPPLVEPPPPPPPPPVVVQVPPATPANLAVSFGVKSYAFAWSATADTTHYQLFEDPDGPGALPSVQAGGNIPATTTTATVTHAVLLHRRLNAQYTLRACNAAGCGAATAALQPDLTQAIGYFKASNTETGDQFGRSVALSADGNTLAVGASSEDSSATVIDGNQANNGAAGSGAVYVFTRTAGVWSQQAYIKPTNTDPGDAFGHSVALSADGSTLAVGALFEDSNATGVNGNAANNSIEAAGAAYVFTRSIGIWSQQAYIKASNPDANDNFGGSVALSADGSTLAVGATGEDSNATGVNAGAAAEANNGATNSGAAYVFTRNGVNWSQQAYIKASNTDAFDGFDLRVALSADGNTLAVGMPAERSNATGINANAMAQADNSWAEAGAVYVFTRNGFNWSQQAYIKASNTDENELFGFSIALSADGTTLAVGAIGEDSAATGIGGDQSNEMALSSGAVYVFTRTAGVWSQTAYIKASNTGAGDFFGSSVALSSDGNTLAVGALGESSNAIGIGGSQGNNSVTGAGAVYMLTRAGGIWSHQAYLKASNTGQDDFFGSILSLSADGNTLAVGVSNEDSNATGINGNQANNGAANAGAVYIY